MKINEVIHRLEEIRAALGGDIEVLGVRDHAADDKVVVMPTAIERIDAWSINQGYALIRFQPGKPL